MKAIWRKLTWWTRRPVKEEELRDELQFHLEEEADEREAGGLAREQAQWAARRELGNVTSVQESTRAQWTWTWCEQLAQDLRYALRMISKNKAFTALASLSLALGIGANTAIYSVMDSILLRSLPVSDPESLAVLNWRSKIRARADGPSRSHVLHSMNGSTYNDGKTGVISGIFPYAAFELLRKSGPVFSSLFAYCPSGNLNLMAGGQAVRGRGEYVSGDYFRGLAVAPAAGRLIGSDDDRVGAPAVAVVSMGFSQRHFGSATGAAGQAIRVNNLPFTVVGVTPPDFFGVDPAAAPDFYVPLHTNLLLDQGPSRTSPETYFNQNFYWLEMMGRMRPGVTLAQAQAALAPIFQQWVATTASNDAERANLPALAVLPGAGGLDSLRRQFSKPLYVLLIMVGLILAIACANIANLLLARATARRREMALRLSLGAGRLRVIRQLLTESVMLAGLGGVLGLVLAIWGIRFLTVLLSSGPRSVTIRAGLNWHVLSAAAALSVLTGLLFGLAPALQSTRLEVMPTLKEMPSNQAYSRLRIGLSQMLVISQIAISLLMLVAAGLFVRTLSNLQSVNVGFNRENLLIFELNARQAGHGDPEIASFYSDLQKRFSEIPGVRQATLSHATLIGAGRGLDVSVSGVPAPNTRILNTGPGFFSTMQIPMRLGRELDERDLQGSPAVAVVNELFAKLNFAGQNPIGRRVTVRGINPPDMEIVGVAANTLYGGLKRDIQPVVFVPYSLAAVPRLEYMTYELRTAGDPLSYVKTVREIVARADPRVPVTDVGTQAAEIDRNMIQEIAFARLCTAFAILALSIACVGLYGTMSYTVARRTGEIGIRMALGAPRGAVVWMVLRQVFALALGGLAIGIPAAFGTSRLVESFLFGMKPNDPRALAAAVATLLGATILAGYIPARRASRIDPTIALRRD
ncbi:MAG TPA: ABC transporter permease [Bryobacteraceae bacterium]